MTSQRQPQPDGPFEASGSITDEDLAILVATRSGAAYVMDLLSRTARPGRGAAPLLRALGCMASTAAEALVLGRPHWFFGTLSADVLAYGSSRQGHAGVTLDVMTDHGGPREALFERTYFAIPLEELRWMLDRIPELAAPLKLRPTTSTSMTTGRTGRTGFSGRSVGMSLYMPPQTRAHDVISADDTAKIIVSPESLFDPDSTSPVPALMAEMAHLSLPSHVDPREL